MNYSDIAITAFAIAVMADLFLFKNSLLTRPAFWTSYAIILPFQFLTNWWAQFPYSPVIFTGGDGEILHDYLTQVEGIPSSLLHVDSNLVFWGMRAIVL